LGTKRTVLRLGLGFAALAALAAASTACSGDSSSSSSSSGGFTSAGYKAAGLDQVKNVTIDAGATIKIGISSALSGDVKSLGLPIADSAAAAGDGVTIAGHKIEFVREDDLCTPEGGPAAADRLIKAGIVAAVGPICSGGTSASLGIYDKAGITHISPSATAGDLTKPTRPEGPYVTFFRVPVLNSDEANAQAKFSVSTIKAKKAFVVFDTDDYGKDLSNQFQIFFKQQGGAIVGSPAGYEKKQTDFKSIIANIKAAKPDMVYMAGFYAEATPFLQQLRADSDLKTLPFMGGDGIKNDELITGAKDAAENAYLALPGTTGPKFADYKAKYPGADSATFGPESWDCATIIIEALKKVGKDNGGKLTVDLKALNDAIKNTNLDGASGTIKFGNNGDRAGATVRFFQVKSGKYVETK
jgi:branched-chain amino acid transport system substrate-binding protein